MKTPSHAVIAIVDVSRVDPLQSESWLLVFSPGQHVHSLPSILSRMRIKAVIISPMIAMQDDNIMGQ